MNRTQEEIKTRFDKTNDMFGIQQGDLLEYMSFEVAKEYLNDDYVKQVEDGSKTWDQKTDAKEEILNYLDFAYSKAENEKGLSAGRSMLHFTSWIWLDNNSFYEEIKDELENYYDYGIPQLDKISKHYGYNR